MTSIHTKDTGDALAAFVHEAVRLQAEQRGLADALEHYPAAAELRGQARELPPDRVRRYVDLVLRGLRPN